MISNRERALLNRAIALAESGEHRVRVGCVAAIKGKTICGAWNTIRNITTSGVKYYDSTRHAEWNCIQMLPKDSYKAVTLYVARIDQEGFLKPSKPCKRCMKLIKELGIKEVIFWDQEMKRIHP